MTPQKLISAMRALHPELTVRFAFPIRVVSSNLRAMKLFDKIRRTQYTQISIAICRELLDEGEAYDDADFHALHPVERAPDEVRHTHRTHAQ